MAYRQFTLDTLKEKFAIKKQNTKLFKNIKKIKPTDILVKSIQRADELPLTTEKSKSEFLISPVLLELWSINDKKFTFFSGEQLNADKSKGLNGECDFLLSKVPSYTYVQAPIFTVVEAKNDIIQDGYGQCGAQMLGARIFNEKHKKTTTKKIYGCVSNGESWRFMLLENNDLHIDLGNYSINDLQELLGVLQYIVDVS